MTQPLRTIKQKHHGPWRQEACAPASSAHILLFIVSRELDTFSKAKTLASPSTNSQFVQLIHHALQILLPIHGSAGDLAVNQRRTSTQWICGEFEINSAGLLLSLKANVIINSCCVTARCWKVMIYSSPTVLPCPTPTSRKRTCPITLVGTTSMASRILREVSINIFHSKL